MTSLGFIDKRACWCLRDRQCNVFLYLYSGACFWFLFFCSCVCVFVQGGGVVEPGAGHHALHSSTWDDRGSDGLWGQTQRAVAVWLSSSGTHAQWDCIDLADDTHFGDLSPSLTSDGTGTKNHSYVYHRYYGPVHTLTNSLQIQLSVLNNEICVIGSEFKYRCVSKIMEHLFLPGNAYNLEK